jgi:predicted O-methyltransferase YrrM
MGLQTISGLSRRGWFIPHRYAESLPLAGGNPPYAGIQAQFNDRLRNFLAVVAAAEKYAPELRAIASENGKPAAGGPNPRFDQGWFAPLDAVAAYTMVRERRPGRIVEIGSGHSTRFLARALQDAGSGTKILSIDPAPRAAIENLAPRVSFERCTVQQVGLEPFQQLTSGDVLFIDSSHILMPGSDVDFLFGRVLPILPAGVLVHIHDIFLPDDYPAAWGWRNYNEQQGVLPMLSGGGWRAIFSSHFVATRAAADLATIDGLPRHAAAVPGSLWLEKIAAASA